MKENKLIFGLKMIGIIIIAGIVAVVVKEGVYQIVAIFFNS